MSLDDHPSGGERDRQPASLGAWPPSAAESSQALRGVLNAAARVGNGSLELRVGAGPGPSVPLPEAQLSKRVDAALSSTARIRAL